MNQCHWDAFTLTVILHTSHFSVASVGFTCRTEPYSPQTTYCRHHYDYSHLFCISSAKCDRARPTYCVHSAPVCVCVCQLTLSRFQQYSVGYYVLQLHQKEKRKRKDPKCRGFRYSSVCSEYSVLQPVRSVFFFTPRRCPGKFLSYQSRGG